MKIIQLNTYDIDGGAARAAYRLHRGLIEIGQQSRLLAIVKSSQDETGSLISPQTQVLDRDNDYFSLIQRYYINANRTPLSNTLFSLPYPGLDLTQLPEILAADIINLHWIAYYQSPVTLKQLLDLGKPVVWTLHDMFAFTGGCHYSSGCSQYQQDCTNCPQLQDDPFHLTSALLKDKIELFANSNLTIVTPSRWLAECASNSKLFRHHRIEVIPYSLETDVFIPLAKTEAKKRLGISSDTFTLLAGAQDGNERRKGFSELLQALKICAKNASFQELVRAKQFRLLCFGVPNQQLQALDLPLLSLGNITSDEQLSQIYSAADIFLLPSLEDNLPNTMLEAMSCGTPVIAFKIGGMSDIVQDGITGKLLTGGDAGQMAQAILASMNEPNLCQQMGEKCRQVIENCHLLPVQARSYVALYQELLAAHSTSIQKGIINGNAAFDNSSQPLSPNPKSTAKSGLSEFEDYQDAQSKIPNPKSQIEIIQNPKSDAPLFVPVNVSKGVSFAHIFPEIALKVSEVELVNLRNQLEQNQVKLKQFQEQIQQSQAQLVNLRTQLKQTQGELKQSQIRISAMETSKFWQLRLAWMRVKQILGLAKDEPP
jgi:glycosyltransferase involved in cell wall biosynthesis